MTPPGLFVRFPPMVSQVLVEAVPAVITRVALFVMFPFAVTEVEAAMVFVPAPEKVRFPYVPGMIVWAEPLV